MFSFIMAFTVQAASHRVDQSRLGLGVFLNWFNEAFPSAQSMKSQLSNSAMPSRDDFER